VFEKKREPGDFKSSASEALSIYGLVRLFLMIQVQPLAAPQLLRACRSFYCLCEVIDLLTDISHSASVLPSVLLDKIVTHLGCFKAAYGVGLFLPKFHMSLHLPSMLLAHGKLLSCFVHERKRKEMKRYEPDFANTSTSYEKGILMSCLHMHLQALCDREVYPAAEPVLMKAKPAPADLSTALQVHFQSQSQALVSDIAFFGEAKQCSQHDFVLFHMGDDAQVARVNYHTQIDSVVLTHVFPCVPLGRNHFRVLPNAVFILTSDIVDTLVHKVTGDTVLVVPKLRAA